MHIALFSEIDPLYSEKNRFHWFWEALCASHTVTVFALRDISKNEIKYNAQSKVVHYLNSATTSPTYVEAFPKKAVMRMLEEHKRHPFEMIFSYNGLRLSTHIQKAFPEIPFWYDLCDDLADLASSSSLIPRPLAPVVRAVAKHYVQKNCRLADRVITTTPLLLKHFSVRPKQVSLIPNGYQWRKTNEVVSLPEKKASERWITFVGALREWVNLEEVLNTVPTWPENWRLLIAGNEGQLAQVQAYAHRKKIADKVYFLGHIPHALLPQLLEISDVGIIPFKKSTTTDLAVTLKLMEYMSCGLPVVSTPLQATMSMFGASIHLVENRDWTTRISEALEDTRDFRAVVKEYTWDALLSSLLQNIENETHERQPL